jgi:dihydroneopterin aldolase
VDNLFTIYIEALEVEAIIGILDFERTRMQKIVVDCAISYERSDDAFINYAEVVKRIESMLVEGEYGLIEDALVQIIAEIKKCYPMINSIKLKLCKPDILSNCTVCVEKSSTY